MIFFVCATASPFTKLPQIYQYDDFSLCRRRYTEFVYCVATAKLLPDETKRLWNVISLVTSNRRNFPRDKLERGLCLNDYHVGVIDDRRVESIVSAHLAGQIYTKYGLHISTEIDSCWKNTSMVQKTTFGEMVFVCISLFLIILTIYATWKEPAAATRGVLIESFAFQQNWHRFTKASGPDSLPFLEGLRAIGMLTILVVHSQLPMIRMPVKNPEDFEAQTNHFVFPLFNSGNTHMIQFFFALGGMVFGLSCLNHFEKCRTFHGAYFIEKLVRRLIRILPAYGFVILYHATWYKRVKRGPLEFKFNDYCSSNWWTNVLFVNNYVRPTEPCLQYGWYLGADMQLFLIGCMLLLFVWRFPQMTRTVAASMAISALSIPAYVIYTESTSATMTFDMRHALAELRTYDHFIKYYLPSHTNVSGYFFGVIAAMLYKTLDGRDQQSRFRLILQRTLSLCSIVLFGLNAFTMILPSLNINPRMSLFHALYGSLLKASWGWCYGVLFLVLALKSKSLLVDVLSHSCMQCLAKLSYCVYIVQYSVIYGMYTNFPIPIKYGAFNLVILTSALVLLSLLTAFLLHMAVESPVVHLGNKLLKYFAEKETLSNGPQYKQLKNL
uniref:Acyltransferase 3 domain-containing protein n=4 Tax=Anopheles atroparvus TaxID=41427 RepID=A0AAG5DBX6_ANOAO